MIKHGNTLAPGDDVTVGVQGTKLAAPADGKVVTVDPESNQVLVKVAGVDRWFPFVSVERRD